MVAGFRADLDLRREMTTMTQVLGSRQLSVRESW